MVLNISGEVRLRGLNFHEDQNGNKNISATLMISDAGLEFNISCIQPSSDTKMAESYVKQYLIDSGAFTD